MKYFFLIVLAFTVSATQAQLIINEVSQGAASQEYVELLVTGNPVCGNSNTVDLRGWIIDDNNGWHASGSGVGVASGHVKFDSIAQWANVKIGSLILVYNDADVGTAVGNLTNDVSDSNNDCVYIVPVSSSVLRKNNDLPTTGTPMTTYAVPGTTYSGTGVWTPLGMANSGDAFHTVSPANYTVAYHAIGWGSNNTAVNAHFNAAQGGMVIYMANTFNNDPFNGLNYTNAAAPGAETPGAPNNPANAAWIAAINQNCQTTNPTNPTATRNIQLCPGQSVVINGATVTTAGTYMDTLQAVTGCDTIRTNNVTTGSYITDSRAVQLCPGQTTAINGQTVSTAGNYNDTIPGTVGCDTIRTYNVTTQPYNQRTQAVSLCSGQSIVINGQTVTTNGTYLDTVSSPTTCDTIVTYNVTVANYITASQNVQLCPGESVVINGQTVSTAGTYNDTIPASTGCDTVRTYTVTTSSYINNTEFYSLCQGQSITIRGNMYSSAGSYIDTVASSTTCDSILTYSITVNGFIPSNVSLTACQGSSITVNGTVYTSNTQFNDTISGPACDTIRTYQLTFTGAFSIVQNITICQGETYFAGGALQSMGGTYYDSLTTVGGCDSIITTNLTVAQPTSSTQQATVCNGDAFEGVVYTNDTVIASTYTNQAGCDSIVTYQIIITPKPTATVNNDTTIDEGQSLTLTAGGGASYLWSSGQNTAAITVAPTQTQEYIVTVSDTNTCSDTATVTVTVIQIQEPTPLIPTAFSPNGDGVNDVFDIVNRSLFDVQAFRIYNRWGELVFESSTEGWDGVFKGMQQPISTYVYYAEVRSLDGTQNYSLKGNLTLLR